MINLDKRKVNIKKLLDYGFIKKDNYYLYEDILLKDKFKIIVTYKDKIMDAKVIDISTLEEYFLVKIKDIYGEYVGEIRELYVNKINDIINNCFERESFKYKQSKDVIKYLKEKYNVIPEFLWNDDKNAALRHPDTLKWFGIIMTIPKNKLGFKSEELIEIIDLKGNPEDIIKLLSLKGYYPAYHMNKKHWFTIILDGSISNKTLFSLIDNSFNIS